MMITTKKILKTLQPVQDPELNQSLVDLNMIRNIQINEGHISFSLILTTPACPLREMIAEDCRQALRQLPEVETVEIEIGAETPQQKPQLAEPSLAHVKNIIAISSGKGGVGKSSVTVNVAVALAQTGAKVGILDADIHGPNVPKMLGLQDAEPHILKRGSKDWIDPPENHGVKLVSIAFFVDINEAIIWRGPMVTGAIRQFLQEANWGELDYLLVDMPPGTGDAQLTLCQAVSLAGAVIVTTPQEVSLLDARRGLSMFNQVNVPVLGIVENMSYFIPPGQPEIHYDIFGSGGGTRVAAELDTPLLGRVPLEIALREGGDRGVPIVVSTPESASAKALQDVAAQIAARVSIAALT